LVPDSPERSEHGTWTALEEGFFAAAPPDVPELPPEPASFDDLLPPFVRRTRAPVRFQLVFLAAAAMKRAFLGAFVGTGRFARGTMTRAAAQFATILAANRRRSMIVLKAVCETGVRHVRAAGIAFVAPRSRWSRRAFQFATASLILVTAFSIAFVVSRRGAGARSGDGSLQLASAADTAVKADGERHAVLPPRAGPAARATAPAAAPTRAARSRRAAEPRHSDTAIRSAGLQRKAAPSRDLITPSSRERPLPPPVPARRPFFSR
jgi:hypothetical protein